MAMLKQAPTERIAGLAFFLFTLVQVPYFVAETSLSSTGIVLLSPLQVTTANLARTFPQQQHVIEWFLIPGAWTRESLSPYIVCKLQTKGGACKQQQKRLLDLDYVRRGANLPLLMKLLDSGELAQQQPILYGSTMIVVSSLFSLVYSVKTAVVGFALLAFGVVQGAHVPLPPGVLTAFLCVYAGFNLGELRGNLRAKQQQRQQQAQSSDGSQPQQASTNKGGKQVAGGTSPSAGGKQATTAKAKPSKTQRRQA